MKLRVLFAGAAVLALSLPAVAQDNNVEGRVTKLEKELKAVQRKVFPDGAGKYFEPDIKTETATPNTAKTASGSEVTDLIGRVDALEAQLAALTGQIEQHGNAQKLLETRLKSLEGKISAMEMTEDPPTPVEAIGPKPVAPMPKTVAVSPTPKPAAATTKPASAGRAAAVAKIEKPKSGDGFQDSYDYGYRLWEAKFFPEAQVQLEETVKKFPSHSGTSRARNLLGRAWLDDGRPSQAAKIFYENYKADAKGERAPESLYFLGESFIEMEKPADACDVFKQLDKAFPSEAAGRLAARLAAGRKKAKCS